MKRFAGIFALTTSIAAVLHAMADAAVFGSNACGGDWPLLSRFVPFC